MRSIVQKEWMDFQISKHKSLRTASTEYEYGLVTNTFLPTIQQKGAVILSGDRYEGNTPPRRAR
jgi:predicted metal-dependent phosphotriesterase family hydrolase